MNYMTKKQVLNAVQKHFLISEKKGEVFGVFLKGSQNYVDDKFHESSDVDTVAVLIPSFEEVFLGKDVNKGVSELENKEQIVYQDVRKFFSLFKKQSATHLESLYTEYFVLNPFYAEFFEELKEIREDLAYFNLGGMIMNYKGLIARDKSSFMKNQTNQKSYSHVMRNYQALLNYEERLPFAECIKSLPQEKLFELKYGSIDKDLAIKQVEEAFKHSGEIALNYVDYKPGEKRNLVEEKVDSILIEVFNKKMKNLEG